MDFQSNNKKIPLIKILNNFDIYHNNKLYYIFPQPDTRLSVKWVAYLDRLVAEEKQKAYIKSWQSDCFIV